MLELDFAQSIGLIAFLVGASAFLHQNGNRFRLHLTLFQVVLCSHFILMGAFTAAFGCGISALRSYASTKTKSTRVMWFFISLLWLMGLPSLQHSYEIITIFGASVATWALFQAEGIKLRLIILFNSFCWLTNNLLLGSIGGTLMESTFIIINLYTISRIKLSKSAI
ncbi:YgjV family protein [Photobacterium sp. ZSDE20]|uniref:YgjV family protein n=1 Tax=Photobacterium pectinilyticum TaxID=2906793 RepID=A0ABT1N4Q1_9GAMM|nr:YgjV family protein [Photobacterium sp. ZSDE20]MCQ1059704.1 YgjV family protein [Photobacterium sp. ZSDE20]MDD1825870.1 YgjV family protein [Photobacterium sp. ZSDE20]